MSKKSIFLTESELRNIVSESIKKVISEMDLTSAAFPDAMLDYANKKIDDGNDVGFDMNAKRINEFERNEKARKLRNQTLTHYLLQEVGPMQFTCRAFDSNVGTNVAATFTVSTVVGFDDNSISFGGQMRKAFNNGVKTTPCTIEYVFESGDFYHNTYINRNKRRMKLLFPTAGEKADSNNRILNAILTCLSAYKAESNKLYNEILKNGGTNRYFDILRKRLANGKKENVPQNIVITNKGEHLPAHRNSHGTDYVSESKNIEV